MNSLNARLRNLQRRLGRREELIAGVVLAVLATSGLAFTLLTNQGTPAGAALAYVSAVDRADTNYVWNHSTVDSAKVSTADTSLLDHSALAAQLSTNAHTRSGFTVQNVSYANTGTKVTLTYNTSDGRRTTSLVMRGGAPHSWPVLVEPAGLDLNIPSGAGALAIDGQAVAASPGSEVKVAVFPGAHKVVLAASHLFTTHVGDADAEPALPTFTAVSFAGVLVTNDAAAEAKQVVAKAFQVCSQSALLVTTGCPQSFTGDVARGAVTWALLDDPLIGSSVGLDDKSTLEVTGHFLMLLTYWGERARTTVKLAAGSPYLAALRWDGQSLSVSAFKDATSLAPLQRPASTDLQVLAALKAQFDICLHLQGGEVPECPQSVFALYGSNFMWRADSDPMQGATSAWDGNRGAFTVRGNFAFTLDYDSTPPLGPTHHYQDHSSGKYVADLFWDGSKVVFIGFEK
jgi:hypothetical protein